MANGCPCTHLILFLLLPNFSSVLLTGQDDLVINTTHGKVRGKLLSVLGGDVRAFLGIPYGKAPVGKLRFRRPEPVAGWEGVKEATTFGNSCFQISDTAMPGFEGTEMWNPNTPLNEDCLYLNVWSPRFNKTQPQTSGLAPVLVWIYGGSFISGTSSLDLYDGRFLSKTEGVVVVSMNYRLGAFGFLSLPDNKNVRGNAGLLDQRLALQWVADNIAAFGGNPSKVTLFGESAGAASVGFHLISPGSQDLFHRAVMQSGSPNAPWATISLTEAWRRSTELASLVGCTTSSPVAMEACLQRVDPWNIIFKQYEVLTQPSALVALPFVPNVDGDFLPDTVEVLLSAVNLTKKEVIFGLNKDEGTFFLIGAPGFNFSGPSLITRKEFLSGVAYSMADSSKATQEAAIFQYTDWTDENNMMKNRDFLGSLNGDMMFCSLPEFAHRYSQNGGKTFLYLFDHRSSVNPWPEWMGVMHGYEIEFVFGMPLNATLGYTKSEVNMTKRFMKHWANFARTGKPSIEGADWPAFTPENQEYVTLNQYPIEQKRKLKAEACYFWNKLIPKVEKVSDDLLACQMGNGNSLRCHYAFVLVLLAIILIYG